MNNMPSSSQQSQKKVIAKNALVSGTAAKNNEQSIMVNKLMAKSKEAEEKAK